MGLPTNELLSALFGGGIVTSACWYIIKNMLEDVKEIKKETGAIKTTLGSIKVQLDYYDKSSDLIMDHETRISVLEYDTRRPRASDLHS